MTAALAILILYGAGSLLVSWASLAGRHHEACQPAGAGNDQCPMTNDGGEAEASHAR